MSVRRALNGVLEAQEFGVGMSLGTAVGDAVRFRKRSDQWYFDAFADYVLLEAGLAPRTADNYVKDLRRVVGFTGKPIMDTTADDLRRLVREYPCANATKSRTVVSCRQFFSWAALEGYRDLDSIVVVRTPKVIRHPKPSISHETARLLLASCRTPLEYRVIHLGLYAGLRIAESASVEGAMWQRDRLKIIGKGRKPRVVPVHPELHKVSHLILEFTPKSVGVLHSALMRVRSRIGAYDTEGNLVKSHALRRTFGQTLYDSGAPWEVVRKVLGHGSEVTDLYVRVKFSDLRSHVQGVSYFSGQPVQLGLFE